MEHLHAKGNMTEFFDNQLFMKKRRFPGQQRANVTVRLKTVRTNELQKYFRNPDSTEFLGVRSKRLITS